MYEPAEEKNRDCTGSFSGAGCDICSSILFNRPQGTAGEKNIEVAVIFGDGTSSNHAIKTSEEFLRGALEQEKLISGEESQYGLFVKTVDGVTADDSKQEWWFFSKDGQMLETSVDSTPIADGDHFEITLTSGY